MTGGRRVDIVEVGPRDGFQSVASFIPTEIKISILSNLYKAGIRRVEATSFVGTAVPQMADAKEVLAAVNTLPGMDAQVLTPTARYAECALAAGASHIAFVLSVSERHNLSNVRRTPATSVTEYAAIATSLPSTVKLRLNVATAFDCPYDGRVSPEATLDLLDQLVAIAPNAEIALCDTTGRATPGRVGELFTSCYARFPGVKSWAFHGHDTYGMGAANSLAAWRSGVTVLDASVAGLGGCPFAPGATGNVATEDLVWLFEDMGIASGISLGNLLEVATMVEALPDTQTGGRVRKAVAARRSRG
jgi:hydroxymethylglutaryl-CoA lyase